MKKFSFLGWAVVGLLIGFGQSSLNLSFPPLFLLIALILFVEVFIKALLFVALSPPEFNPAQSEQLSSAHQLDLSRYTTQLKQLGFVPLRDYTLSTSKEEQKPFARLFAHPQECCFAEIGITDKMPTYCSIFSYFENQWSMGITDMEASNELGAISHAFLRLPNRIAKITKGVSVERLFQSFINWRGQVLQDLSLTPIQDVEASIHIQKEVETRATQRQRLLHKSITWCFIEMALFRAKPKTEWLGSYKPVQP